MDFLGILEFLSGLGFPLPLCAILIGYFIWIIKIDRRISKLEDTSIHFVKRRHLDKYVRCDICEKTTLSINLANKLAENLNAEHIKEVETRVGIIETQLKNIITFLKTHFGAKKHG